MSSTKILYLFLYCNNEPLQEQKVPDVLPAVQAPEASTGLNNGFCFGTEIRLGLNLDIAALPVKQRYFIHCLAKGWRPSIAGLLGFIRLLQLGYYKTLWNASKRPQRRRKSRIKGKALRRLPTADTRRIFQNCREKNNNQNYMIIIAKITAKVKQNAPF